MVFGVIMQKRVLKVIIDLKDPITVNCYLLTNNC